MFRLKKLSLQFTSILMVAMLLLAGCAKAESEADTSSSQPASGSQEVSSSSDDQGTTTSDQIPKYIFLFIGDGMSFPQVTAYGFYNGTMDNNFTGTKEDPTPDNAPDANMPSFLDFPVVGSATTYDASKFVTDSASAATAIACSTKTLDGMIGLDPYSNRVTSVAERLKADAGYNVGIVSTVCINHATPAGFYAHVPSRNNYYDIALDLVASDFDFFGGGQIKHPTGKEGDQEDVLELAQKAGYNVADTYEEISALNSDSGKTIAMSPVVDNPGDVAINYLIDRDENEFGLSTYVEKALEVMGDEEPFFIMAEGGKVDWSSHANDAYTTILEIQDLEASVNVAVEFANKHPDETLILVTGDHETGGFSMGFGGTEYNTYLYLLEDQKLSFQKFKEDYIDVYRENEIPFETAMQDVKEIYGLIMPDDPDAQNAEYEALILSDREVERLREAYTVSMIPFDDRIRDFEYKSIYSYDEHEPFQVTVTQILNNRAGLGWTTTAHTGLPVGVYASGTGASNFTGFYDNTDISKKILELVGL